MRRAPHRPVRLSLVLDVARVGGAEIVLLNTLRHVDPALVAAELICLREGGPLAEEFRAAGFPAHVLGRRGWWDMRTVARLARRFRASRTDVVLLCHHQRAALTLGRWVARLTRVPANVIAAHDMDLTSVGRRVLPRHVVETLRVSDALALLAPSQSRYLQEEEGVGRFPWRRVPEHVVPNGIDVPEPPTDEARREVRQELGFDDDEVVVASVARLSPQKNHRMLLEVVRRVAATDPRVRLVLVGDGQLRADLEAEARALGIGDRVVFTGLRRDVGRLLAGFDVLAMTSVHEGVPIAVIEAMAAGLPVVATDCGGLRDTVADGQQGYIVPVHDTDAFTERLTRLVGDPDLRAGFAKAARVRVEREFSIDETARRFEQMVAAVTAR